MLRAAAGFDDGRWWRSRRRSCRRSTCRCGSSPRSRRIRCAGWWPRSSTASRSSPSPATSRGSRRSCCARLAAEPAVARVGGRVRAVPGPLRPGAARRSCARRSRRRRRCARRCAGWPRSASRSGARRSRASTRPRTSRPREVRLGAAGRRDADRRLDRHRADVSARPTSPSSAAGSSAARWPRSWPRRARASCVYEREAIAAGASGRNSGVVQHPLDPALVVALRGVASSTTPTLGHGFELPADPVGVLLVTDDPDNLEPEPSEFPELRPTLLEGAALRAAEPTLADGLVAWRLETGRPVPPAAAANAFAARAREAGAEFRIGEPAFLEVENGRAAGVTVAGELQPGRRGRPRRRARGPPSSFGPGPFSRAVGRGRRAGAARRAAARARGDRHQGADAEGRGAERALQRGDRARDQRGRVDVHGRAARPGGAGADAAGERDALPARPEGRHAARGAGVRAAELRGRLAVPGRAAGPGGRERGERPRRVGDHARAGVGPARGRSAAGAAGGDPAGAVSARGFANPDCR